MGQPLILIPLFPAGCTLLQPLQTTSQGSGKVGFGDKSCPEPVAPPLNPGSSPTPHKMSPLLLPEPAPASQELAVSSLSSGEAFKGGIYLYPRREAPCAALALCK